MTDDPLARTVQSLLGARPTPAQRRAVATQLEALAHKQRQIADAAQAEQAKPADKRLSVRKPQAGPGRAPSLFVRVCHEPMGRNGATRLRLYVGRGLWYALGSPARMDLQRVGGILTLRPASADQGMAFAAGKGMPRAFADGWADVLRLEDGRYAATVAGGAIVIGAALE